VYPVLSAVSLPDPSHKVKEVPFQALQKYRISVLIKSAESLHISLVELYSVTNISTGPAILS
jgi:hypothetical protein